MRLSLDRRSPEILQKIRSVAPAAAWAGEDLVVPGRAKDRARVLDLVRDSGVEIRNLVASDGRLDSLYQELVREDPGTETQDRP
jgi:hypothetical protein